MRSMYVCCLTAIATRSVVGCRGRFRDRRFGSDFDRHVLRSGPESLGDRALDERLARSHRVACGALSQRGGPRVVGGVGDPQAPACRRLSNGSRATAASSAEEFVVDASVVAPLNTTATVGPCAPNLTLVATAQIAVSARRDLFVVDEGSVRAVLVVQPVAARRPAGSRRAVAKRRDPSSRRGENHSPDVGRSR